MIMALAIERRFTPFGIGDEPRMVTLDLFLYVSQFKWTTTTISHVRANNNCDSLAHIYTNMSYQPMTSLSPSTSGHAHTFMVFPWLRPFLNQQQKFQLRSGRGVKVEREANDRYEKRVQRGKGIIYSPSAFALLYEREGLAGLVIAPQEPTPHSSCNPSHPSSYPSHTHTHKFLNPFKKMASKEFFRFGSCFDLRSFTFLSLYLSCCEARDGVKGWKRDETAIPWMGKKG